MEKKKYSVGDYILGILLIIAPVLAYVLISGIIGAIVMMIYIIPVVIEAGAQGILNDSVELLGFFTERLGDASVGYMVIATPMFVGAAVGLLWLIALKKYSIPIKKSLNGKRILFLVCIGLCADTIVYTITRLINSLIPGAYLTQEQGYDAVFNNIDYGTVVFILAICIVGPIAEEVFFRGIALRYARKNMPTVVSVILTSIAFGLLHLSNSALGVVSILAVAFQVIYATVYGLVLGYVAVRFKNIWASIIIHMSINTLSIILAVIPNDVVVYVILAVVFVISVAGIYFLSKIVGYPETLTPAEEAEQKAIEAKIAERAAAVAEQNVTIETTAEASEPSNDDEN